MEGINEVIHLECEGLVFPVRVMEEQKVFQGVSNLINESISHGSENSQVKEDREVERNDDTQVETIKDTEGISPNWCDIVKAPNVTGSLSLKEDQQLQSSNMQLEIERTTTSLALDSGQVGQVMDQYDRLPLPSKKRGGRKGRRKVKPMDEILGKFNKIIFRRKGSKIRRSKGAIFRPAITAASLSISSEGINNRNRILLNKAQKVLEENLTMGLSYEEEAGIRNKAIAQWDFEKSLGVSYDGDEEEVISKIAEMEKNDEARYRAMLEEGQ